MINAEFLLSYFVREYSTGRSPIAIHHTRSLPTGSLTFSAVNPRQRITRLIIINVISIQPVNIDSASIIIDAPA